MHFPPRSSFVTPRCFTFRDTPWCSLLADGLELHGNRRGGSCGRVNHSRRGANPESSSSGWTGGDPTRGAWPTRSLGWLWLQRMR